MRSKKNTPILVTPFQRKILRGTTRISKASRISADSCLKPKLIHTLLHSERRDKNVIANTIKRAIVGPIRPPAVRGLSN